MNLKNLERTVEDDYISNLRNSCWKEKQQSMFARKTNRACSFIYLFNMNIDCWICQQFWENDKKDILILMLLI